MIFTLFLILFFLSGTRKIGLPNPIKKGSPSSIMGSLVSDADRTKTKESVLRKLNEKRWKPGPSGDNNDVPPSARKLWESPSKTVVNNFEDLAVNEGTGPSAQV